MKITATLLYFNKLNLNNRIYKKENIDLEKINEMIENGFYGELGYPEEVSFDFTHLNNISHKIEKVYIKNNELKAHINILDTNKGIIVKNLINESLTIFEKIEIKISQFFGKRINIEFFNIPFVFRPRCIGTVKNNIIFVDKIISFDIIDKSTDSFNKNN